MQPGNIDRIGLSKNFQQCKTPVKRVLVIVFLAFCFVFSMSPEAWAQSTWQQVPGPGDISRYGHAMATDTTANTVYMFGGRGNSGVSDELWKWDGTNWLKIGPSDPASAAWPPARFGHRMVFDASKNELLVFGGKNDTTDFLDDMWVFSDGSWTEISKQSLWPSGRHSFAMAHDTANGHTFIYGGSTIDDKHSRDMWRWDGNSWEEIAASGDWPGRRYGHSLVYDSSANELVLFGGSKKENKGGAFDDNQTWTWNGSVWSLESPASSPAGRHDAAMGYDAVHNRVTLMGGASGSGNSGTIFSDTWIWDGSNWTAHSSSPAPSARYQHAMTYDPGSNGVILFGGNTSQGNNSANFLGDTWSFDGSGWQSIVSWPGQRYGHATAYDPFQQKVYLFGGVTGNGKKAETFNDLWEWDGSQWTQIKISGDWPAVRHSHDLAFDIENRALILYGGKAGQGNNEVIYNDTWQFSGGVWQQLTPAHNPGPRYGHSMAYFQQAKTVILTAGRDKAGLFDDTWRWNGSDWVELTAATIPTARSGHAMVYNSNAGNLVLFGGTDVLGNLLSDTLTFDGSQWTQALNTGPTGRTDHDMAYDSLRGVIVLFSGNSGGAGNDTWELGDWDGTGIAWKEVFPGVSPDTRQAHAMSYDPARGRVVLFGGKSGQPDNETWLYKIKNSPPEITLACPTEIPATYSCNITATITDPDNDPITATLFYRSSATANAWIAIPMTADGSTFSATIPANHVSKDQLDYYIAASDGVYLNTKSDTCSVSVVDPYGSLSIDVNVDADWVITQTRPDGTVITVVTGTGDYTNPSFPAGSYQVEFKDYAGWNKPDPYKVVVTLAHLSSVTVTGTYIQQTGTLTVNIQPPALQSTAKWMVNGTSYNHGQTITLPVGNYQVTFTDIANYSKPAPIDIEMKNGDTQTHTGIYTQSTGNLTVTILPEAVRNLARWKATNTSGYDSGWKTSGTTLSLPVGVYTVQFNAVAGYNKPGDIRDIDVTGGDNESYTRTYTQSAGNLTVTILPTAVRANARWKAVNASGYDSGWQTSGTTLSLSAGTYTVQFNTVSGYTKPVNIGNIVITSGASETRIGTYTRDKGYLKVYIEPDAVRATARWCVNGTCYAHGKTITLPTGNYTITFTDVSGYTKPVDIPATVYKGQTTVKTGTYTQKVGNLKVYINPDAVRGTARWCVNGKCYTHGTTITLPIGNYTVTFTDVAGYSKPAAIPVTILNNQLVQKTGTYTQQTGYLKVNLTPTLAATGDGRWKAVNGIGYDSGWQTSGTTISVLAGNYTVIFMKLDFDCWFHEFPEDQTATVTVGNTTTLTGEYMRVGSIVVVLDPFYASEGGTWRQIRPGLPTYEDWHPTNYKDLWEPIDDWRYNPYQIEYHDLPGWPDLAIDKVPLTWCETVVYKQRLEDGYLQCFVSPSNIGAKWYIYPDTSKLYNSGDRIRVKPAQYRVGVMPVSGYITPVNEYVKVYPTCTTTHEFRFFETMTMAGSDFDGDGKVNLSVFRPDSGEWLVEGQNPVHFGGKDDKPVPGDYNGDGNLDIAFFREANGMWFIHGMGNVKLGQPGDIPVPADYNGDGTTDIAVFRPSEGKWIFQSGGQLSFGVIDDVPVPADYDGDGITDIAVYRPNEGKWYLMVPDYDNMEVSFDGPALDSPISEPLRQAPLNPANPRPDASSMITTITLGGAGMLPVPADYNGDGKVDAAMYDPQNGSWWMNGEIFAQLGEPGDIPVPGDYNGDGTIDIAVFSPAKGKWIVKGLFETPFGQPGDIPLVQGK